MRWALAGLATVCVVRLWLMQLPSSFWVDEMASVFVVEHGAGDPSLKVAPQVAQSIYYPVIRSIVAGRSEIAYRVPSVLFMILALWFGALIAARLIHPDAGWLFIFASFALRGIDYEAANARPYAMGMCVAAAGLYFLIRWLDTRRLWDAALFVIFAALLWRVHLIFWPFYFVFAIYAILQGTQRLRIAIAFGVVGLLLVPVAMRAIKLNAQAGQHVVIEQPTWMNLAHSLHLPLVVAVGLGAWIWAFVMKQRARALDASEKVGINPALTGGAVISGGNKRVEYTVLAWWMVHPVALFAYSRITGNSVFVPRYLTLSLPGAAAMATLTAGWFLPSRFWKPAALVMGCCALIVSGDWKEVWPSHHNSDWRVAAAAVNRLNLAPSTPVICPSPFVEARSPAWTPDYQLPGFLYAQLPVYPVRGNVVLFPFVTSAEVEQYAAALAEGAIPASGRFVIYGANGGAHFWRDWFEKRPELAGWRHRSLGDFKDVDVVLFEKE